MTGSKADIVEVMARAFKDALGKAMNAKPLLGDASSGDWYTEPSSGSLDLCDVAQAALTALEAAGYTVIKKTPGIYHPQEPFEGEK